MSRCAWGLCSGDVFGLDIHKSQSGYVEYMCTYLPQSQRPSAEGSTQIRGLRVCRGRETNVVCVCVCVGVCVCVCVCFSWLSPISF